MQYSKISRHLMPRHVPRHVIVVPIAAMLALAGCGQSSPGDQAGDEGSSPSSAATLQNPTAPDLRAAAEPFEALTEEAFAADRARLDTLFSQAHTAAAGIRSALSPDLASQLDRDLAAAQKAIEDKRSADIALAAVDGYRAIVEALPDDTVIPKAVSLLDYAGFRIQADLKSRPARWQDVIEAVSFAQRQWDSLKGRVGDEALKGKFEAALSRLDKAVDASELDRSTAAVSAELDLVDDLETYFQAQ